VRYRRLSIWDGYLPGPLVVPFSRRDADVAAAWGKPVQSDRVTTTSVTTVNVAVVVMSFSPFPMKVVNDRVVDLVSHEVGMV
jgi:hypothetical protein